MVKYCLVCGIEIADTSYDTLGRFNAVKYCTECAIEQKKKANKRDRQKRKMRKAFEKETEEYGTCKSVSDAATVGKSGKRIAKARD